MGSETKNKIEAVVNECEVCETNQTAPPEVQEKRLCGQATIETQCGVLYYDSRQAAFDSNGG